MGRRSGTGHPSDVSGRDLTHKYKRDSLSERRHLLVSRQTVCSVYWTKVSLVEVFPNYHLCFRFIFSPFPSSEILGQEDLWNILLCIPALFSVAQVLVLPLLPDAPRHLFIEKGDEKACQKGGLGFPQRKHSVTATQEQLSRSPKV